MATRNNDTYEGTFKNKRMENAYYWAAQAAGWLKNGPNAGIDGRYYVEVIGGKPVVVLDDSFTESAVKAGKDSLLGANFPAPIRIRELDDEWRLFISEPSDDRLVSSYYEGDWRDFEVQGGFDSTRFGNEISA
jgi:hypothetical protein